MRSPEVWKAMVAAMEAEPNITDIVGSAIYLTEGERKFEVPSITGTLLFATQGERFVETAFQLDAFAKTLDDAVMLGEMMLRLFDHDVRKVVGGLRMWTRCTDEREFHGPVADGVYRRSLDFEQEVIRRRYVRAGAES